MHDLYTCHSVLVIVTSSCCEGDPLLRGSSNTATLQALKLPVALIIINSEAKDTGQYRELVAVSSSLQLVLVIMLERSLILGSSNPHPAPSRLLAARCPRWSSSHLGTPVMSDLLPRSLVYFCRVGFPGVCVLWRSSLCGLVIVLCLALGSAVPPVGLSVCVCVCFAECVLMRVS